MSIAPSLVMIPSGYKAQKVYSAVPTNGDGDFDFARSTTATRVNKDGLIEEVAVNVPRLDYSDGGCPSLLLEPSRLQKIQYSENFSQGYWTKQSSTINSNNAISPDGTLNADLYTTSSAAFDFIQTTSSFIVSGYSFSVFAKKGTSDKIQFSLSGTAFTNVRSVRFDLTNKTTETLSGILSSKIEEYPNGWFRCSIYAVTNTSGSGTIRMLSGSSNNVSTLYLYGVQVEEGYVTSYIPNYGASAGITRSSEIASGAGDASTFNDSEGVLYAQISALSNSGNTYRLIGLNNGSGTNTNRIFIGYTNNNSIYAAINDTTIAFTVSSFDVKNFNKVAVVYNGSIAKLFINGSEVGSGITNAPTLSGLSRVDFSGSSTGANGFKGNTKDVRVYNTALTDAELQALTTI